MGLMSVAYVLPLLVAVYSNWMKPETIPQHFLKSILKLLRKNKYDEDEISNFQPLTILNTDLGILVKTMADRFLLIHVIIRGDEYRSVQGLQ